MAEILIRRNNPLAPLTEAEIRSAAIPAAGRLSLRDPSSRGLVLRISAPSARRPNGTKAWSLEIKVAGRPRRFTLGRYPDIGLAEARKRAGRLRAEALDGRDLSAERREARRAERLRRAGSAEAVSLTALLDSFERIAVPARGITTWSATRACIERNFQALMAKAPADLTKADIRAVLDAAITRGSPVSGKSSVRYLRRVLAWGVQRELLANNPAAGLDLDELTRPDTMRQRVLSDDEIKRVWAAAGKLRARVIGDLARFYLLTGLRREEAAGLRWSDIESGMALIGNTKNGTAHRLPLSSAALAIIDHQPKNGEYIFLTRAATRLPVHGGCWFPQRINLQNASCTKDWTWHDLRRTCRTLLARIGVDDIVAELILNHTMPGQLRRTYNLHRYENEMHEALERLATFVERLVTDEPGKQPPHKVGWAALGQLPGTEGAGGNSALPPASPQRR